MNLDLALILLMLAAANVMFVISRPRSHAPRDGFDALQYFFRSELGGTSTFVAFSKWATDFRSVSRLLLSQRLRTAPTQPLLPAKSAKRLRMVGQ
jgi:hypothetical protein